MSFSKNGPSERNPLKMSQKNEPFKKSLLKSSPLNTIVMYLSKKISSPKHALKLLNQFLLTILSKNETKQSFFQVSKA